jgi:hypothetical protein
MGQSYQPERRRDRRLIGPGGLRPGALAELAVQHGEFLLEQLDFRIRQAVSRGESRVAASIRAAMWKTKRRHTRRDITDSQ